MDKIEIAKLFQKTKLKAMKELKTCYHPKCNLVSINSHILQKNGILSSITNDGHLWEQRINPFKDPPFEFKKVGINKLFSFNCFCKKHDTELFKKIELNEINFNDYESLLLFTLRTIYNEKYRKQINIKVYESIINSGELDKQQIIFYKKHIEQENLGIEDITKNEIDIWNDLNKKTESYIFKVRTLTKIEICLSAFYNYETTFEINMYRLKYGKDMERVSDIFINLFPYKENSILLMGYNKKDEKVVKSYFYTFFKESEKRVQRKLTNLVLFACETWVISEEFYNKSFKGIEDIIYLTTGHMIRSNFNERIFYPINFCSDNFKNQMKQLKKRLLT